MTLTERDLWILHVLIFLLRMMTEFHILRARWPPTASGRKNGQRRLAQLCESELLQRRIVHAKLVRGVVLLHAGSPEDAHPDCVALSRESRRLWAALPMRPVVVYAATQRARNIFGGPPGHGVHALGQVSHDLGVAAVYVELLRRAPELAAAWRSEDEQLLPQGFGDAQPDAVLVDAQGRPSQVIEFAADYPADRFRRLVRTFHGQQRLPYAIYGGLR